MMPTDTLALSKICAVEKNGVHHSGDQEFAWVEVKPQSEEQLRLLFQSQYGQKTAFYPGNFDSDCLNSGFVQHLFVDFSALCGTREHVASDLVIACQTGITVSELNRQLAPFGQFFPVDTYSVSVEKHLEQKLIDVILRGDGGYLESGFGLLRSQVLGLESVYGGGEILKSGGRVLKNVTGFDVGKLIIGSRGSLAFPYLAYLRLYALPEKTVNFCVTSIHAAELLAASAKLLSTGLPLSALEIIELERSESESETTRSGTSYQLLLQVAGTEEFVSQVAGIVCASLAPLKLLPLAEEEARRLLNTGSDSDYSVEVAASLSLIRGLLESLISVKERGRMRIRAASGRLFMQSSSVEEVVRDLELITAILKQCRERGDGSPLVVSAQKGTYRFDSQRLGQSQPAVEALLLRLKEKFDPASAMNPQVSFH